MRSVSKWVIGSIVLYAAITARPLDRSSATHMLGSAPNWLGVFADPVPIAIAQDPGSRLRARYLVGDDGSRQFLGWHDGERGEDCSFGLAADNSMRCLPTLQYAVMGYYGDSQCTTALFAVAKSPCMSGKVYATNSAAADCRGRRVYELTPATVTQTYLKTSDGTGCSALSTPSYTYYTGVEVPASSFVAAREQTE